MQGWVKQVCDGCGRPAEIEETTVIYKCAWCGSVYERVQTAPGVYQMYALKDAMVRHLSATEFVEAKAFVDSLPGYCREVQAEINQAQAELEAAQREAAAERAKSKQDANNLGGYAVISAFGAIVALGVAINVEAMSSALMWLAACIAAILVAWYNFSKWQEARSRPSAQGRAAERRAAEATKHLVAKQAELEQARLELTLRKAQIRHRIQQDLGKTRKTE